MSAHDATLGIGIALLVLIPLTLWLGKRTGVGASFLVAIATAFFMGFVVPHIPGSPIACLDLDRAPAAGQSTSAWLASNPCAAHMDAVYYLNLAVPLLAGFAWAEVRDFRRRR